MIDVKDEKSLQEILKQISNGSNAFVLIYMNGCSHCETTKPEWAKINKKQKNVIICQIDKDILENKTENDKINLRSVRGFPTIIHYSKKGKTDYQGKRNVADFEKWIDSIVKVNGGSRRTRRTRTKRSKRSTKLPKRLTKFKIK